MPADEESASVRGSLDALAGFLEAQPLTSRIAALEEALTGMGATQVQAVLEGHQVKPEILMAALDARRLLGRVSDVIHALTIVLALPSILQPGEVLRRPSLAAGNDPSRPFDVETNLRVAEFKVSSWDGHDAARKREVFKDLVHLAAAQTARAKELYVIGPRPGRFLRTSRSTAAWGLTRWPPSQALFVERFGPLTTAIRDFTAGPAATVSIIDIAERLTGRAGIVSWFVSE